LCNILNEQEIKPHKVRYYLERRDPEFKQKMAEVLCVYREVKLIKETAAAAKQEPSDAVAIVSYDEKPGIQAIATTAPDLPPEPGRHRTFARDHEYKRLGTVSLLAGIDLLTGQSPQHFSMSCIIQVSASADERRQILASSFWPAARRFICHPAECRRRFAQE
jgi:hypothetical protein